MTQSRAVLNVDVCGIPESHRGTLRSVSGSLQEEFGDDLLGIIVGGSVGRGNARQDSDLDMFVLVGVPWSQRRRSRISGIEVDMFVDPAVRVRNLIRNGKNPVIIENYATGRIVWDPDGATVSLARQAIEAYKRKRNEVPDGVRFSLQERAKDLVAAIERDVDASRGESAQYLLSCLLVHCVSCYYDVNGLWDPPPKRRIDDLRQRDPMFSDAVELLLSATAPMQRRVLTARWLATRLFGEEMFDESHVMVAPRVPYFDESPVSE
jgi:predicted nucleotidyltransferase